MNQNNALLSRWMSRLTASRLGTPASSLQHSRIEVRPPRMWPSSLSWHGRLVRWLDRAPAWVPAMARPRDRLARVRNEFLASLPAVEDAECPGPVELAERIGQARSLRELWHLRLAVFGAVALATSQSEAERRLARLNRHFPVHVPRGGPGLPQP